MKSTEYRRVIVFLDWDTARRIAPSRKIDLQDTRRASRQIELVFERLQDLIASFLAELDRKSIFRVRWRLYHGWYSGKTKTRDYHIIAKYLQDARSRTIGKISFGADVEIASSLLIGGNRMPLFDSLRMRSDKREEQKMVDTGLTCDLLQSARTSRDDVHLVYGDDDDLLPGLFTAEAWGITVHMIRPEGGSQYLNTSKIVTVLGA